jgi:lipopolysaccharide biosynthesis glycosyltransferase
MKTIHVALASDERYFPGLLGAISSMLISSSPNNKYHIYILDGGISPDSWKVLESILKKINRETALIKLEADLSIFKNFPGFYFKSVLPYGRLLFENLIQTDKIIYIDSDILVLKNIEDLWNVDLGNYAAAAALEIIIKTIENDCPSYQELGINPTANYFNSGVMVMDLKKFREQSIFKKATDYLQKYYSECKFWDQSALNVVLYNNYILLDQSWNIQSHKQNYDVVPLLGQLSSNTINFHFVTKAKPWLRFSNNPAYLMYYKLLETLDYTYSSNEFIKTKKSFTRKISLLKFLEVYYFIQSKIPFRNRELSETYRKRYNFWTAMRVEQKTYLIKNNFIKNMLAEWKLKIIQSIKQQ